MSQTYSPTKNYVMQLNSILQNDKNTMDYISESLQLKGYVFVRLPMELVKEIDSCVALMEKFFAETKEYKTRYAKEPIFGYFGVDHKESYRLLTGSRITEQQFPYNFHELKDLVRKIDKMMYTISTLLSPSLFPDLFSNAKKLGIPFFDISKPWGMFDLTKYHNDGRRFGMNCKEHYDPGLLSFHIRSTEEGLQLKNEFGKWIKVPNDKTLGIIWAGKAANDINPKIKPGVHRVVCGNNNGFIGKPRIALWHEICTKDQEHTELIKKKTVEKSSGMYVTKLMETDKGVSIARSFEKSTGIPMSKSMR